MGKRCNRNQERQPKSFFGLWDRLLLILEQKYIINMMFPNVIISTCIYIVFLFPEVDVLCLPDVLVIEDSMGVKGRSCFFSAENLVLSTGHRALTVATGLGLSGRAQSIKHYL